MSIISYYIPESFRRLHLYTYVCVRVRSSVDSKRDRKNTQGRVVVATRTAVSSLGTAPRAPPVRAERTGRPAQDAACNGMICQRYVSGVLLYRYHAASPYRLARMKIYDLYQPSNNKKTPIFS